MRSRATPQTFRREGEYWTIAFDGQVVRLKDSRGLQYLAALLRRPGHRVAATELVIGSDGGPVSRGRAGDASFPERARLTVTKGIKAALGRIAAAHPPLGRHLEVTVRRGHACAYTPDPRHPIVWEQ
jgi:hypothetical protein